MNLSMNSCFAKIISAALMALSAMMLLSCNSNTNDKTEELLPLFLLSSKLILFNAGTHDGNLKGATADARTGADGICTASANKPAHATNVHAFISISSTDQIKDMPANYGYPNNAAVYGPDGTFLIWNNWADMLDGSAHNTLSSASVLPAGKEWLSGSDVTGTSYISVNECNGFTDADVGNSYEKGLASSGLNSWIFNGTAACNVTTNYVLCICEQ
jgi:hypothetical protein